MNRYHDRDYEYIETDGPYSHDGGMYRGGHVSFPEFVAWKHAQEHDDGTVTAPIVYDARISDGDGNIMKYWLSVIRG